MQSFEVWLRGLGEAPEFSFPSETQPLTEGWRVAYPAGARSFYEVRVRPARGELQVGFSTENRSVNEEIEEFILEQGGDLDDLLDVELSDLGVDNAPHMEHFFERPLFRFVVRDRFGSETDLDAPLLKSRVRALLIACRILFQPHVEGA